MKALSLTTYFRSHPIGVYQNLPYPHRVDIYLTLTQATERLLGDGIRAPLIEAAWQKVRT